MQRYIEIPPTARLARYIECYWSRVDSTETPHRVLPDGCADVLFSARNGEPQALSLVGLMTAPQLFVMPAGHAFFGIRFRPGMAAAFIPEAAGLNDRIEPLENLLGAAARELFERLGNSASDGERACIMDALLRPLEAPDAGQKALQSLSANIESVDRAALDAGLSSRHLRRLCLQRTGVSPKYLGRILRFRKASERIATLSLKPAQPNWADLAAACGYYDQAHFIREFQHFTGDTPGRFLQSLRGMRNVDSAHDTDKT